MVLGSYLLSVNFFVHESSISIISANVNVGVNLSHLCNIILHGDPNLRA